MRTPLLSLTLVWIMSCPLAPAQSRLPNTDIPAGPVSGIWTRVGSPYHVAGEITVPNDSTLRIEPGVEVVFLGHHKLNVQGRLLAVGTREDTIRFRAADTQEGWHGIRFDATPSTNDTSKAIYCSFKFGNANTGRGFDRCGGAMLIKDFDKVLVSHCLFDSNSQSGEEWFPAESGGAIKVYAASPTIAKSTFSHNTSSKASAIGCDYCPNVTITDNACHFNHGIFAAIALAYNTRGTISRNTIANNVAVATAAGFLVDNGSTPMIINNLIVHNQGFNGGITCYRGGKPILIGNTIAYNTGSYGGGGIGCRFDGDPVLINNILYGNAAPIGNEIGLDDDESDPVVIYCDVNGGKEGIEGDGGGMKYAGIYEHNINVDPRFVNGPADDYRLSDASPCIGAGIDSVEVAGGWYMAPPDCLGEIPRPSPAETRPDIGAYESLLGSPVVGVRQAPENPMVFAVRQNYPNPFNPTTTITYELPNSSMVRLSVHDILGREVSVLVNERKCSGSHEVRFDALGLSSGVYLYRLEAGDVVQSKSLILLK